MDKLPPEILHAILKVLADRDEHEDRVALGNVRRASRALSNVAAPFLFATIPLWFGPTSVQNLKDLSKHEQM